ncbi:hypothetical protein TYRP_011645 [Tyrophagus putrescentiae]|nr:hypothetical protein TYRP_011645 [Tyrophagus putrescentiae]
MAQVYGVFALKINIDRKLWVPITLDPVATSIKFKNHTHRQRHSIAEIKAKLAPRAGANLARLVDGRQADHLMLCGLDLTEISTGGQHLVVGQEGQILVVVVVVASQRIAVLGKLAAIPVHPEEDLARFRAKGLVGDAGHVVPDFIY